MESTGPSLRQCHDYWWRLVDNCGAARPIGPAFALRARAASRIGLECVQWTGTAAVLTGGTVLLNSSGQLGILTYSAHYQRAIEDIGERSRRVRALRPLTFQYPGDVEEWRQYGLIAEEVAKVSPELVVQRDDGRVEAVQDHTLVPMLLTEWQRQQPTLEDQQHAWAPLKAEDRTLQAALAEQSARLAARRAAGQTRANR